MKKITSSKLILFAIIVLAIFFRFSDINWDQNNHLHPDERFLTMVTVAMKLPDMISTYFNPQTSPLNPTNVGYPFYVYGTLPLIITKYIAVAVRADTYIDITLLGRLLSAFADVLVVYLLFKTVNLLEKRLPIHSSVKYYSALFYAIAVLPMQLSHFFAVDTFLNFFSFAAFYCIVLYYDNPKQKHNLIFSALFWGFALGSKISAIFYLPLLLFVLLFQKLHPKITAKSYLFDILLFGITGYLAIRIADPYLFQNSNIFNPIPNTQFLENIKTLQSWGSAQAWYPPGVQWIHKTPILFALQNITFFGMGLFYTLFAFLGMIQAWFMKSKLIQGILLWMLAFFLYQSTQVSMTMRYFIFLYPFFAIFAAVGFYKITKHANMLLKSVLLIFIFIWPVLFYSIYTKPHSRVTASNWILLNIPTGSIILSEHWDDALPLRFDPAKQYTIDELHVFDPDTAEKWQKINEQLQRGHYLILSSNRGWGSIPTVPERYPQMKQFYADLFANKLPYKKVAEFTSYPSLSFLGIPITINDDWSEEAFTVYDHPKVMIFQKQ